MEKCTLLLKKILGEKKYLELLIDTIKNLSKKRLEIDKWIEAMYFNHQTLLFIATQKAEGIDEKNIEESLKWQESKENQYILVDSVSEFCEIYAEYVEDIVNFIKRK